MWGLCGASPPGRWSVPQRAAAVSIGSERMPRATKHVMNNELIARQRCQAQMSQISATSFGLEHVSKHQRCGDMAMQDTRHVTDFNVEHSIIVHWTTNPVKWTPNRRRIGNVTFQVVKLVHSIHILDWTIKFLILTRQ